MAETYTTRYWGVPKGSNRLIKNTDMTPPHTPTVVQSSEELNIASEIRCVYNKLIFISDLKPGEEVNGLLSRLVHLGTMPRSDRSATAILLDIEDVVVHLRELCSAAEGELETYWVRKMLIESRTTTAPAPADSLLKQFPYYSNYLDLSRLEVSALSAFLPSSTVTTSSLTTSTDYQPKNIAFIGSGPLPLSSLCLLPVYPDAHIFNIDRSASALSLSSNLCTVLDIDRMRFCCEDATSLENTSAPWADMDVVFLAALVGMTEEAKMDILEGLKRKLKKGCLVLVRSARGLRKVLYPELEISDKLENIGFEILAEVHPWNHIVNSVIVLRVR